MTDGTSEPIPTLVAHRGLVHGLVRHCAENTIESVKAALEAGATHIEVDVHLSADGVPVLHHDEDLQRMAGDPRRVADLTLRELLEIDVAGTRIPPLAAVADVLRHRPDASLFVEIKPSALHGLGRVATVERVLEHLEPVRERSSVISFDAAAIELARAGGVSVGWILDRWNDEARRVAEVLAPAYLFCDHEKIPPADPLWPGPWQWALYEVADAALALRLAARGAAFVETMAFDVLLRDLRPE